MSGFTELNIYGGIVQFWVVLSNYKLLLITSKIKKFVYIVCVCTVYI